MRGLWDFHHQCWGPGGRLRGEAQLLGPPLPSPAVHSRGAPSQAFPQLPCSVSVLPSQVSARLTSPGLTPQAPPSLASVPDSRLLLPGDFTSTRPGLGSDTTGVYLKPLSAAGTQATPSAQAPSIQPGPSLEGGEAQAYSPVAPGHADLEAELEGIQQQLQDYQATKQNLQ